MIAGRLEQRHALFQRHGDGRRRLVRGRHIDEIACPDAVQRNAVFLHRQIAHRARPHGEDVARVGVSGLFHAHRRAFVRQQLRQHGKAVLRPQRHEDLVVARHDAAPGQDAAADLLHQQRIVQLRRVGDPVGEKAPAQRLPGAFAPFGQREEVFIHLPVDEGIAVVRPVNRLVADLALARARAEALFPVDGAGRGRAAAAARPSGARREGLFGDEITRALPRVQIAVIQQALIGQHDGIARHAQQLGHLAGGGNGLLAVKRPVENGRDQRLADLRLKRKIAVLADVNQPVAHEDPRCP